MPFLPKAIWNIFRGCHAVPNLLFYNPVHCICRAKSSDVAMYNRYV